ncbi:serine hydrolase domain-containing protein [Kineosporia succinea]|uniref:CubicO group peptidase (Beta-lactamase class C family) n=1 Tax=Kineosporia succinea TaxID=84632 RepID=A0ABT9NVJ7_9ACTN|nr:serine hydrolase [Kineosporia succinea]MDP9824451.1 CubicO group peptidase (beta-lactamase class C family) [Kineosporia succinea]
MTTAQSVPLPRSTPSQQGVSAAGISAFLDAVASRDGVEPHSLVVVKSGTVVAEGWWAPYTPQQPALVYSISKSFTATALGLAVAEGLVDLDATVLSYFPELDADVTNERARSMKVRHVAAMASGHQEETLGAAELDETGNIIRGFLRIPPDEEPGSVFAYNQPCTMALAQIVQRTSGSGLLDYLRPRLFEPLGIDDSPGQMGWITDPQGREIGYSGLHVTTEALAKVGLLYLQGGVWEGKQVLPEGWVELATQVHVGTESEDAEEAPDCALGYGFQIWRSQHGYRFDGAFAQFVIVLPEHDAVVAITSQTPINQALLDEIWAHLVPALTAGAREGDAELAERLAGLTLPVVTERGVPTFTATSFEPVDVAQVSSIYPVSGASEARAVTEVEIREGGPTGWEIVIGDGGVDVIASLAPSGWVTTGAVATQTTPGKDHDGLRIDVVFLETPHGLVLELDPAGQKFGAVWETEPLHLPPLAELRAPRA